MTEKHPKDMTAGELMRWAANDEPNEYGNTTVSHKLFSALSGKPYGDTNYDEDARNIRALADKIDAEIEAARKDAVKESKKPMWWFRSAIRQGEDWPAPHDGEKFREYLKRCFIQRPLDEDGEPVQFGEDTEKLHGVEKFIFTRSGECCQMQDARGNMQNAFPGQRVKRPAPDVLGADGLPIVEGETVWLTEYGAALAGTSRFDRGADSYGLCGVSPDEALVVKNPASSKHLLGHRFVLFEHERAPWCPASWLTHTPPDTQERIDEDAQKTADAYWGCIDVSCEDCPAKIDGKNPHTRFGTRNCAQAQMLDLLRRQRELDKRMGGE